MKLSKIYLFLNKMLVFLSLEKRGYDLFIDIFSVIIASLNPDPYFEHASGSSNSYKSGFKSIGIAPDPDHDPA
jgi:hypothetical protein